MASSPIALRVYGPPAPATRTSVLRNRLQAHLLVWLPVVVCSLVFAVESTSYLGADRTSAPMHRAFEAIFGQGVGLHWELVPRSIRKAGHFVGYGMFCLVCFRCFWIELKGVLGHLSRQLRAHGLALLATFLVASADEIHQSFLPNRYGEFSDVVLDTCGGLALGLAVLVVMQVAESLRRGRVEAVGRRESAYFEAAV